MVWRDAYKPHGVSFTIHPRTSGVRQANRKLQYSRRSPVATRLGTGLQQAARGICHAATFFKIPNIINILKVSFQSRDRRAAHGLCVARLGGGQRVGTVALSGAISYTVQGDYVVLSVLRRGLSL